MARYEPTPQFSGETYDVILQRMMDRVSQRDKREGAVIWDSNASSAIELQLIYLALEDILLEAFGDSASREFLIRRAAERNIHPFPATHAVLRGRFTPEDVNVAGRRFSMPNTTLTYVVEEPVDDEFGGWAVKCEQPGSEGNQFFGAIVPLTNESPRLQTAEIFELLIPGQDVEDTESIRQRYFDSFDERAFGGNIRDYQVNVRNIDGVGAVKVTPIWNGGGTVLLTILDYLLNPASDTLIDRVQEIIDPTGDHMGLGLAPIGHQVTVRTADVVNVDISFEVSFIGGFNWELVQDQVIETLEEYLLELRKDWENQDIITPLGLFQNPLIVRISHINSRVLHVLGIRDVLNTTINGQPVNLEIDKYSIPMLGVVSV